MTHVKALEAGHSSQGTSEPITPACRHQVLHHCLYLLSLLCSAYIALHCSFHGSVCNKKGPVNFYTMLCLTMSGPMLKHWRPDILARGHLSLLHRHVVTRFYITVYTCFRCYVPHILLYTVHSMDLFVIKKGQLISILCYVWLCLEFSKHSGLHKICFEYTKFHLKITKFIYRTT